jgi:hypothetical protein
MLAFLATEAVPTAKTARTYKTLFVNFAHHFGTTTKPRDASQARRWSPSGR